MNLIYCMRIKRNRRYYNGDCRHFSSCALENEIQQNFLSKMRLAFFFFPVNNREKTEKVHVISGTVLWFQTCLLYTD